jgi:hypothetical protein
MGNKQIVLFAFLAAGFLAGCFNPMAEPNNPAAEPKVLVVQIAGEAGRTALPSTPAPTKYTISVKRGEDTLGGGTFPAGSGSYPVELTKAPKKDDVVTVAGLNNSNVEIAKGSHTLTESDISGNAVSITLYPLTEGRGKVDLSVNFVPNSGADEITKVTLKLYKSLTDYTDKKAPIDEWSYGTEGTAFTVTDSAASIPIKYDDIDSGNYVVMIEFFRGADGNIRVSRLVQTVIVRGGLTTDRWDNSESSVLIWNAFASSNADLASEGGIKIDGGAITGYSPDTQTYNLYEATTSVPASKTLTVTGGEPGQAIAVSLNSGAAVPLASGQEYTLEGLGSNVLALKNTLLITVTAPDGFTEKPYTVKMSGNEIIDFYFTINGEHYGVGTGITPVDNSGIISDAGFTIIVPYGADISSLTPTVNHSGDSISPAVTAWGSSSTPHNYTVTAVDGTQTREYRVGIDRFPNTAKAITAFSITSPVSAEGVIDEDAKTVTVTVPYGTNVTAMTASVSRSPESSINPADPETSRDYTNPLVYTVTAQDSTSQDYTVTVNQRPGITIGGITVAGLGVFTFTPSTTTTVSPGESITITLNGTAMVDSWYVDINGPVTPTSSTTNTVTFNAPEPPGFYNVNVFATVNGIPYSGSLGLVVN